MCLVITAARLFVNVGYVNVELWWYMNGWWEACGDLWRDVCHESSWEGLGREMYVEQEGDEGLLATLCHVRGNLHACMA